MDKDYLLEEITEGLAELAPLQKEIVIHATNENERELSKAINEVEMIVEHLASCLASYKEAA